MDKDTIIARLKRHKVQLRKMGLVQVSLFGSTARGAQSADSDVDLAVTLDETAGIDLFRFAAMSEQVARLIGTRVDLVVEPARNARMQAQIDRDRLRVF
jgi:uncharacterized protein